MESYEEQQSDALEEIIFEVRDVNHLINVESQFGNIKHPNIGFRLGVKWMIFGNKNKALPHLVNSISFCLSPKSSWIQTGYADSMGQCIFHLINKFQFKDSFNEIKYKLIANAYICFSGIIRAIQHRAYDSLNTRAWLIEKSKSDKIVQKFLNDYYYSGDDLCCEILTLSDYTQAAGGFQEVGKMEYFNEAMDSAVKAYNVITSKPQYELAKEMSIDAVTEMSKQNQEYLFNKVVKDFINEKFYIAENEFRSRTINDRIII